MIFSITLWPKVQVITTIVMMEPVRLQVPVLKAVTGFVVASWRKLVLASVLSDLDFYPSAFNLGLIFYGREFRARIQATSH